MLAWITVAAIAGEYVQADVLVLRAAPDPAAAAVARLPIYTPVDPGERSGDWVAVNVPREPDAPVLRGWVLAAYIGGTVVTADAAWAAAGAADDLGEAVRWAERAVAARGSTADWRALAERYAAAGRAGDAERATLQADGLTPTWVAWCDGRRLLLAAEIDPSGTVEALQSDGAAPGTTEPLHRLARDLGTVSWRAVGVPGSTGNPLGVMLTPFIGERWDGSGDAPLWTDADPSKGDIVVLGPCDRRGMLAATRPLVQVPDRAVGLARTTAVLADVRARDGDGTVYGVEVRHPFEDEAVLELLLTRPEEWYHCGGLDTSRTRATGLVLRAADGRNVVAFGSIYDDIEGAPVSVEDVRWFVLPSGVEIGIASALWFQGEGLSFVSRREGAWTTTHAELTTWGC